MLTTRWLLLCLGVGLLGCTSTESRCETLCQAGEKCGASALMLDCSESGIDRCVDEYDRENEACQDAFDNAADCIEEQDLSCPGVQNKCIGQLSELASRCKFGN